MKLIATFNIFNEAQFLRQAIESVTWCDSIIVVDGAYKGYPSPTPMSNDGTVEIVKELMQTHKHIGLIQFDRYAEGYEKVEAYLKFINDGDYFIRMNGDEVFEGDSARLCTHIEETNLPMYQLKMYPVGLPQKFFYCPKILRKAPGLRLTSRHVVKTNKFVPPYTMGEQARGKVTPLEANLPHGALIHMREHRNEQRAKDRDIWLNYYYQHCHDII